MKGSAFKLNNVATKSALTMKSPLHQNPNLIIPSLKDKFATTVQGQDNNTYRDNATLNVLDPFNNPDGAAARHNAIATQQTKGKGKNKYYSGNVRGQAAWIRKNFGHGFQNDKKAMRAFYQAHNQDQDVVEETPVVENQVQREDKGVDNQTEFSKAVNKGYFNKGEGSEFVSTEPKAEDFATFEEFEAANRKHEMDNPNVKTMANYKPE